MDDYPRFRSEPWHWSELEDYSKCKSDSERWDCLRSIGYDPAHIEDFKRLYAARSPAPVPKKPINWGAVGAIVGILAFFLALLQLCFDLF